MTEKRGRGRPRKIDKEKRSIIFLTTSFRVLQKELVHNPTKRRLERKMEEPKNVIVVNRDFSHVPGGRYRSDGKHSAEEFRDEILIPALTKSKDSVVLVDLDGIAGMASSFAEEAFGGLVRHTSIPKEDLLRRIRILSTEQPYLIEDIQQYIKESPEFAENLPERTKQYIIKRLKELEKQEAFARLKKNIKIQLTSEGLRIILNESENSPAFFEPGSAKLLQKSAVILMTIAREIGRLDNRLVIEGHTSSTFTGQYDYSNWELSADRANAARQLMEVSGVREGQIREVRGFADQFPMIEHDPTDSRNRRVTLVILYQARERQYDEIEVGTDLIAQQFGP